MIACELTEKNSLFIFIMKLFYSWTWFVHFVHIWSYCVEQKKKNLKNILFQIFAIPWGFCSARGEWFFFYLFILYVVGWTDFMTDISISWQKKSFFRFLCQSYNRKINAYNVEYIQDLDATLIVSVKLLYQIEKSKI